MKVSVITATFNSSQTVKDCIQSVNDQTYPDIEHIFIDGDSKDNTLELISTMTRRNNIIISEPDEGLYDAMNKGISNSSGDIVAILNSDDLYYSNNIIEKIVEVFKNDAKLDGVHGDLVYVKRNDITSVVRHWRTGDYKAKTFKKGWHPAHPTLFLRKNIYDKCGMFNLDFALAADFELMLRLIERYQILTHYLSYPLVKMRMGGATNKNIQNIVKQNFECYNAFTINEINVSVFYPFLRLLPKFKQFFGKNKIK